MNPYGVSTVYERLLAEPPGAADWMGAALCAETDPEIFFPEKGESPRLARQVCARCPVTAECLEYALEHDERWGVWGGMSERDRRPLRRAAA